MLRFALNPTQDMQISNLRVAIFNYILSKQLNEKLLIRVEDSNKQEDIEGKDKELLEILSLFSIEYSHVVYQSENLKYHQKLAMQLMSQKKAFACFCSDEKLEELKEEAKKENRPFVYDGFCENLSDETVLNCNVPFTVRVKKSKEKIEFSNSSFDIDSFIILNHNKTPTSNYACAVDDMLYDISTIITEEEHILDIPKQIHIRKQLNYEKEINYIYLPTILNSKDNESSVKWLIQEGFLPSAIANYLVLLGNKTPTEIFSLEEAVKWFDIKNISKSAALFDIDKLRSINRKYLKQMEELRLSKILGFADTDIGKLGKLFLEEASTIKEIKAKIDLIFTPKSTCIGFEEQFIKIKACIQEAPYFDYFSDLKVYLGEKTNLTDENLSKPLKYILTGGDNSLDISKIYPLIKNYLGEIIK